MGAEIVGVGVLCNRSNIRAEDIGNVPKLYSLVSISLDAWEPDECALCAQGIPINTSVGKGREFLEKKK